MSVFWRSNRGGGEERSTFIVPITTGTDTGYAAQVTSAAASLQSIAVRSAVDLIASLVSELPMDVYQGKGSDRVEMSRPDYLNDPGGDGAGLEDWLYQMLLSWLLRGNAYGEIQAFTPTGLARQVAWLYPDDVRGQQSSSGTVSWTVNGRAIQSSRMLHRRVNPVPGRVLGLSPVEFHATSLGLSLSAVQFGSRWFQDGGHPSGLLTNSETTLTAEQASVAKSRFAAMTKGSREPVVLGKGWEFQQVQVTPEESQFLETQRYTEAQCARIFGAGVAEILGYETGGSMTYANVVDRRVDLLVLSVGRWIRRAERVLSAMLPRPQYAKLNRNALLETTPMQRYMAYQVALQNGFRVINEVRDDEDEPAVPWGDVPFELTLKPNTTTGGSNGQPA